MQINVMSEGKHGKAKGIYMCTVITTGADGKKVSQTRHLNASQIANMRAGNKKQ
jgi:hypothetical protein